MGAMARVASGNGGVWRRAGALAGKADLLDRLLGGQEQQQDDAQVEQDDRDEGNKEEAGRDGAMLVGEHAVDGQAQTV
jgi:hypothetical protein